MSKKSLTQLEHCRILLAKHRADLRYVVDERAWLRWDGRWRRCEPSALTPLVIRSFEDLQLAASKERDTDREMSIRTKEHRGHIDAVIDLLSREPDLQVKAENLDADEALFGVANGVVDLRTGELVGETREMLLTKHSPVEFDPDATQETWCAFVDQVFGGDAEVIDYVQRVLGYCLTGSTDAQEMWLLVGAGSNGKSTFLSTVLAAVGDYGQQAGEAVLLDRARAGAPAPEVTRLRGARLAVLAESEQDVRLNEVRMKGLVSGDPVAARGLYQDIVQFTPQVKFLLATNHLPTVSGTDEGVWRRLTVIPFEQKFAVNGDPTLRARLRDGLPGVLAWAVQGAVRWYEAGSLERPASVTRASQAYRDKEDVFGAFLRERFVAGGHVMASDFRSAYIVWCEQNGVEPQEPNSVGALMRRRGHRSEPFGKARRYAWKGISLIGGANEGTTDCDEQEVQ
jgi:putative DNA primase/helicase